MENSMNVSHEFIDDKESTDDQKCNSMNNAAVICVGSTGTGKSSLIKLFCGNNVKVGHTVKSETQGSSLFKEANCDRYWLDSQGANDSQGVDDEKVLTDVLKTLYDNSITNIKVIWCISGDFDRAKQEFQTQAKFIKSLGNGVWNSCLIVQKKGPIEPDDIDGVLEAARNKGANDIDYGDNRLFGYTGIDYMTDGDKQKDRVLRKILKHTEPNTAERNEELLEDGYLNNKQIVEHINERLSNLTSLKIIFAVKKCEKCGVKGDPRFVYAPCHSEIEKYHPKATVPYHKEDLKIFHLGEIVKYHDRRTEGYHTGKCIKKHLRSTRRIHPGGIETDVSTEKYHRGKWIPYWIQYDDKNKVRGYWTCCKQQGTKDDAAKKGCCERVGTVSNTWTCCGKSSSSSGCTEEYICCGQRYGRPGCTYEWDCCGRSKYDQGCKRRYKCCHRDEDEPGCKSKYACCDGDEDSAGCREEYSCCKAAADNPGCKRKYECCDEDEGETDGCEDRCKACHKKWGDGPGCIETTKNRK